MLVAEQAFVPAGLLSPQLTRRVLAKRKRDGTVSSATGVVGSANGDKAPKTDDDDDDEEMKPVANLANVVAPPHALCRIDSDTLATFKEQMGTASPDTVQRLQRVVISMVEQFYSSAACLNAAYVDYSHSYQHGTVGVGVGVVVPGARIGERFSKA